MIKIIRQLGLLVLFATVLAARASAQTAATAAPRAGVELRNLIIEDSLTEGKKLLRGYVAELRDTLVRVQAVQDHIVKARAAAMTSVVMSQGRDLARNCLIGAEMIERTTTRLLPMGTPNAQGDQALHSYRGALNSLRDAMRECAHFDSLTMATKPVDQQKLENIATAASDAVSRYDLIRDGLMRLFGITLPITGNIHH